MIAEIYKQTVLGAACANLGHPVNNAYFYRDVVPQAVTDEMLTAECERILAEQAAAPDALQMAETHVARFFSTVRLLQMKVWWDTFPHELTPKLAAVFAWSDGITRAAVAGENVFGDPPHTFVEVAQEATSIVA
jgi:hypothetical protein